MRHVIFWHFAKGLLNSISNVFSLVNITSDYLIEIINISIIGMRECSFISKVFFSNALAAFWNTLSEIDIYRTRGIVLIRCFEKISLKSRLFHPFYFVVCLMYVNEIVSVKS